MAADRIKITLVSRTSGGDIGEARQHTVADRGRAARGRPCPV